MTGITGITVIEGVTNPEIVSGTRYEYCTFDGLDIGLDENTVYEGVVFENCDFIDCDFRAVMWYKCEWLYCYACGIGMYSNIFALCEIDMQVHFSRVKRCIAFGCSYLGFNEYKEEINYI